MLRQNCAVALLGNRTFSHKPSTPSNSFYFYSLRSAREAELRRLRKANIEFEEQNAVLQRHIKDMYNAKERLEAELGQDEKRTQALQQHLMAIKHTLVNSLSSVPLPGQRCLGQTHEGKCSRRAKY